MSSGVRCTLCPLLSYNGERFKLCIGQECAAYKFNYNTPFKDCDGHEWTISLGKCVQFDNDVVLCRRCYNED